MDILFDEITANTLAELEKMDTTQLEHILAISKDINGTKENLKRTR